MNENNKREIKEPSENALLTEYQVCEHDNSSSAQSYWIIFGIFMALNTAILGGLVFTVFQSDILSETLFQKTIQSGVQTQIAAFCAIAAILGIIIMVVFYKLRNWLDRVNFLIQTNNRRMRTIEINLGMWKSWRVHLIDQFYRKKQELSFECEEQIKAKKEKVWTNIAKEFEDECSREIGCDPCKLRKRLEENREVLMNMCLSYASESTPPQGFPRYKPRSRELVQHIFCILNTIWGLIIIACLIRFALAVIFVTD
jgi:hypothetical protein